MLLKTAIRIILHEKTKFAGAVAGVALAIFLVILQWGFYFGYRRDTTVVLDAFDADIWIIPKGQSTFDGFTTIDDRAYWKAKDLPEIEKAARVVWGIAPFRHCVNGSAQRVQLLGVDFDSGIGVNLQTGTAIVPAKMGLSGVRRIICGPGWLHARGTKVPAATGRRFGRYVDGAEIFGRRAKVVGFVENVHLFTTLGFRGDRTSTTLASFCDFAPSHITYVACKCRPGADVPERRAKAAGDLARGRRTHLAGVPRL